MNTMAIRLGSRKSKTGKSSRNRWNQFLLLNFLAFSMNLLVSKSAVPDLLTFPLLQMSMVTCVINKSVISTSQVSISNLSIKR